MRSINMLNSYEKKTFIPLNLCYRNGTNKELYKLKLIVSMHWHDIPTFPFNSLYLSLKMLFSFFICIYKNSCEAYNKYPLYFVILFMSKIIVIQIVCLRVNREMRIENAFKHFNDKFDKFSHHINKTAEHNKTKGKTRGRRREPLKNIWNGKSASPCFL